MRRKPASVSALWLFLLSCMARPIFSAGGAMIGARCALPSLPCCRAILLRLVTSDPSLTFAYRSRCRGR